MKNLKDIALEFIDNISEGILDDIDTALETADDYMYEKQLAEWSKNSKTPAHWWKKRVGYTLQGDYKITDIDDEYAGPKIRLVKGDITICNTNLKSLKNIFVDDCVINGSLIIENNKNLESLEGAPAQCNTLMIINNPKLSSPEGAPEVLLNMYWMRNGKKYKPEKLQELVNVHKRINCSVEDNDYNMIDESFVNEAFKIPQLIKLAEQIKQLSTSNRDETAKINHIFGDIKWDQLDNSNVSEYDGSSQEALKAARMYISHKRRGIIILFDKNNDITGAIRGKSYFGLMKLKYYDNQYFRMRRTRWSSWGSELKANDLLSYVSNSDYIVIIDTTDAESTLQLQHDRWNTRTDAVALNRGDDVDTKFITTNRVRYYQNIADANRERYKKTIDKLKAERALKNQEFNTIKSQVDSCFDRYTALINKMLANPSKYHKYDIEYLNDKLSDKNKYGLLKAFNNYVSLIIELYNTGSSIRIYGSNTVDAEIKRCKDEVRASLLLLDVKLKELEAK